MSFGGSGGDLSQKLWVEVQQVGAEAYDELVRKQDSVRDSMSRLMQDLAAGNATVEAATQGFNKLGAELGQYQRAINALLATRRQAMADSVRDIAQGQAAELASEKIKEDSIIAAYFEGQQRKAQVRRQAMADSSQQIAQGQAAELAAEKIKEESIFTAYFEGQQRKKQIRDQAMADSASQIGQGQAAEAAAEKIKEDSIVAAFLEGQQRKQRARQAEEASVKNYISTATADYQKMHSAIEAGAGRVDAVQQRYADSLKTRKQAIEEYKTAQASLTGLVDKQATAETAALTSAKAYDAALLHLKDTTQKYGLASPEAKIATDNVAQAAQLAAKDMQALGAANDALGGTYSRLTTLQGLAGGATAAMGQKMQGLARTMMFTAQGLEDLQYGFFATVNNIPLVVNEIGKLVGMTPQIAMVTASVASLGGIAISQLIKHWDDLFPHVDKNVTHVEVMKKRIDELNAKKIKVPVERVELLALEADLKRVTEATEAYNRLKGLKSEEEHDSESEAKKVVAKDSKGIREALLGPEIKRAEADANRTADDLIAAKQKEIDEKKYFSAAEYEIALLELKQVKSQRATLIAEAQQSAKNRVGALVDNATGGGAVGETDANQEKLAARLEAVGRGQDAMNIRASSPAAIKARKQAEKDAATAEKIKGEAKTKQDEQNREAEAKAKELGGDLGEWFTENRVQKVEVTAAMIKDRLERAGTDFSATSVEQIMKALQANYDKAVNKVALKFGGDAAEAESAMADSIEEKKALDANKEEKKDISLEGLTPRQRQDKLAKDKADKLAKAAETKAKAEAAKEALRLAAVARTNNKGQAAEELDLAETGEARAKYDNMPKWQQQAMVRERARMFAAQEQQLRNQIKDMRPKTDADYQRRSAMFDRADMANARSQNPFPTVEDEQHNLAEAEARRMFRGHTQIKDKATGKDRNITLKEAREAAALQVAAARKNMDAQIIANGDGLITAVEKFAAVVARQQGILGQQQRRIGALNQNANTMRFPQLNPGGVQ